MGMTMTQKILAKHAGLNSVEVGDLIVCEIDLALANDITGPPAIQEFGKIGKDVFDKNKIALIPDHFTPNKDIKSAMLSKAVRDFAKKHSIKHYYEMGRMGIEHVVLPDWGLVAPGELVIGADSHTCTYGAVGAFATGVGQTDLGASMATGNTWFRVPSAVKVNLIGKPPATVKGKDIILTLIGMIGVDGARYESIEFVGEGIAHLTMADRFTICNMAIEAGGKNGIFPVDEITEAYLAQRVQRSYEAVTADADAVYSREVTLDLAQLVPVVALPHLPENVKPASTLGNIKIDQAVIGSCTNGRLADLAQAAQILKGKTVHPDVRVMIVPGSQEIYLQAMELGYIETFINSGCVVNTPSCGPCMGGHMGVLAPGERCISTTNRNFRGRMGHVDSEVYLCSPYVAAASAIAGYITEPTEQEVQ